MQTVALGIDDGGQRERVGKLEVGLSPDVSGLAGQAGVDADDVDPQSGQRLLDVRLGAGPDGANQNLGVVDRALTVAAARAGHADDLDRPHVVSVIAVEEPDEDVAVKDDYRHPSRSPSR